MTQGSERFVNHKAKMSAWFASQPLPLMPVMRLQFEIIYREINETQSQDTSLCQKEVHLCVRRIVQSCQDWAFFFNSRTLVLWTQEGKMAPFTREPGAAFGPATSRIWTCDKPHAAHEPPFVKPWTRLSIILSIPSKMHKIYATGWHIEENQANIARLWRLLFNSMPNGD